MQFPFPKHIVWHSPGFLSLTVPYDPTRDFFYSGHTASLIIITLEFYTLGYRWFTLLPVISLIYMMNMLLITRVHYTIDIAGGIFYAFFLYNFASRLIFYMDWVLSVPYLLGKKALRRYRQGREKESIQYASLHSLEDKMLHTTQEQ